jgi:hypothetical protein
MYGSTMAHKIYPIYSSLLIHFKEGYIPSTALIQISNVNNFLGSERID